MKKAYIKHVETWKPEIVFDNDYFHGVEIELTDDEHALIVAYDELRKKYVDLCERIDDEVYSKQK